MMEEWKIKERGSIPGPVELFIMMYVCGKSIFNKIDPFNVQIDFGSRMKSF